MELHKVGQRGGKTTQMVEAVKKAVANGDRVLVVAASAREADRLRLMLPKEVRIVWKASQTLGLRGFNVYVDNFTWDRMGSELFTALERLESV
jgi:hypothetical protein